MSSPRRKSLDKLLARVAIALDPDQRVRRSTLSGRLGIFTGVQDMLHPDGIRGNSKEKHSCGF